MTETAAHTFESFIELARESGWSRKQTRDQLYRANQPELWARRDEMMAALGFATTDQTAAAQQAAAESQKQREAEQVAANQARLAAERAAKEEADRNAIAEQAERQEAARTAISDGAVIFCDGAENTVVRVVNCYGRQAKFDNGGYRAGIKCGEAEEVHFNTKCPDQFAAECWSVLKAVEFAAGLGLKSCTIRNDRIAGFEASVKRGYIGAKYLWVAKNIAAENGIDVAFEQCSSAENLADAVARRPGNVR